MYCQSPPCRITTKHLRPPTTQHAATRKPTQRTLGAQHRGVERNSATIARLASWINMGCEKETDHSGHAAPPSMMPAAPLPVPCRGGEAVHLYRDATTDTPLVQAGAFLDRLLSGRPERRRLRSLRGGSRLRRRGAPGQRRGFCGGRSRGRRGTSAGKKSLELFSRNLSSRLITFTNTTFFSTRKKTDCRASERQ